MATDTTSFVYILAVIIFLILCLRPLIEMPDCIRNLVSRNSIFIPNRFLCLPDLTVCRTVLGMLTVDPVNSSQVIC